MNQCCDALRSDPHLTLLEAFRDTYLAAAHTVTPLTQDAERVESPHFRARLHAAIWRAWHVEPLAAGRLGI